MEILNTFEPVGLEDMDRARLMNRTDTKYVIPSKEIIKVLREISTDYCVLEINGHRMGHYETLYFDTEDLLFYHQHHNGKKNRLKVRYRKYVDSEVTYLEVKKKSNKNRTIKIRKPVDDIKKELTDLEKAFVDRATNEEFNLHPTVSNRFQRTTLVGKNFSERVTIDFGLELMFDGKKVGIPGLSIIEAKQDLFNRQSKLVALLKQMRWRSLRVSKYCLGMSLLKDNLKTNNFKEKLMKIEKLENEFAS